LGDCAAQAIVLGEPLLEDAGRLLGPDHPDTLTSRNNLAAAYRAAGRYAEAIRLHEQTLADRVWLLGPDHLDTLQCAWAWIARAAPASSGTAFVAWISARISSAFL
jgi:tetratricopeptide repeat protein